MAFQVETGAGARGSNSYVTTSFVDTYLADRGRETENTWSTLATNALKEEACVRATSYIDTRWGPRFKGIRLRSLITGRNASGTLTLTGLPVEDETVTIGTMVYRWRDTLAAENDVLIAASATLSVDNLVAAINGTGDGTDVHEDTISSLEVTSINQSGALVVQHLNQGESGNDTATTETMTNGSWAAATLTGGLDRGPQPLEFPRSDMYDRDGRAIVGIPLKLKHATAEYAVRSLTSAGAVQALAPDPEIDDKLARVTMSRVKAGPIEEETRYAEGGILELIKPFPEADRLLAEYVRSAGGTMR